MLSVAVPRRTVCTLPLNAWTGTIPIFQDQGKCLILSWLRCKRNQILWRVASISSKLQSFLSQSLKVLQKLKPQIYFDLESKLFDIIQLPSLLWSLAFGRINIKQWAWWGRSKNKTTAEPGRLFEYFRSYLLAIVTKPVLEKYENANICGRPGLFVLQRNTLSRWVGPAVFDVTEEVAYADVTICVFLAFTLQIWQQLWLIRSSDKIVADVQLMSSRFVHNAKIWSDTSFFTEPHCFISSYRSGAS